MKQAKSNISVSESAGSVDVIAQLIGVSRSFGNVLAVDNISLQLHRGQIVALLGVNGAGKSTTLQMLSGNLAPTTGSIRIGGHDLQRAPRAAKNLLGYLPDHAPLYGDMTVREFLRYAASLRRLPATQIPSAVARAVEQCDLGAVERRLIGNLSKGFRQRVGIAAALVHGPSLLILDEPTVGLDVVQVNALRALIRQLRSEHAVLLSTHILGEVQSLCDRVYVLHAGRIVHSAAMADFVGEDKWYEVLLRRPPSFVELSASVGSDWCALSELGSYRAKFADDGELDKFVAYAVQRGWGLVALAPQRASLERVFLDVVARDATESTS